MLVIIGCDVSHCWERQSWWSESNWFNSAEHWLLNNECYSVDNRELKMESGGSSVSIELPIKKIYIYQISQWMWDRYSGQSLTNPLTHCKDMKGLREVRGRELVREECCVVRSHSPDTQSRTMRKGGATLHPLSQVSEEQFPWDQPSDVPFTVGHTAGWCWTQTWGSYMARGRRIMVAVLDSAYCPCVWPETIQECSQI